MCPVIDIKNIKKAVLNIICFTVVICAQARAGETGLYVGARAGQDILSSDQSKQDFFEFVESPFDNTEKLNFSRILWLLNSSDFIYAIQPDDVNLREIITGFGKKNVKTAFVFDITEFIIQQHDGAVNYLNQILSFNNSSADISQSVDSIVVSAQFEVLLERIEDSDDIPEQYAIIWQQYIILLTKIKDEITKNNIDAKYPVKLAVSMPASYDTDKFDFTDFRQVVDIADQITVYPRSKILNEIKQNCEAEINYAENSGKPVSISLLAKEYKPMPDASFYNGSLAYFYNVVYYGFTKQNETSPFQKGILESYPDNKYFSGIDIDGYELSGGFQNIPVPEEIVVESESQSKETALDYNSDGVQDDAYKPYYKVYAGANIGFYINFGQSSAFYAVTYLKDLAQYTFTTTDGFTVSNNHDNVLQPLEKGTLNVTINTTILPADMTQNMASGALQIQVAPDPVNTIVPGNAVPVTSGSAQTLEFFAGKINRSARSLPLKINLFNTSSGKTIQLNSSEIQNPFNVILDDKPLAHFLTVEGYLLESGNIKIISSLNPKLKLKGWAFDDSDLSIKMLLKPQSESVYQTAGTLITRYAHSINTEIPYWGADYKSGFTVEWTPSPSAGGFYDLYIEVDDGYLNASNDPDHRINLPQQQIFINRPPICSITAPKDQNTNIYSNTFDVSVYAKDTDTVESIGAKLAQVRIYLADSQGNVIQQYTKLAEELENNSATVTFTNNMYDGSYDIYAEAQDSFGLITVSEKVRVRIYPAAPPEILRVEPKLGTFKGNNYVKVFGTNLKYMDSLSFGGQSIPMNRVNFDSGKTSFSILMPESAESKYWDIELGNYAGSDKVLDAYRVIPGEVIYLNDFAVKNIKYNNSYRKLYLLGANKNQVDIYLKADNSTTVTKIKSFSLPNGAGKSVEVSKYGDNVFVLYENSNIIDVYNQDGNFVKTVTLYDNDGTAIYPESLAYLMNNKLIAGTSGAGADLFLIDLEIDLVFGFKIGTESSVEFDEVKVYPCSNMAGAYILCKNYTVQIAKVYYFDSKTDNLSPVDIEPVTGAMDTLSLAVNYNGYKWMMYSSSSSAVFNRNGKEIASNSTGFDIALFDIYRDVIYSFTTSSDRFAIYSCDNLADKIADCGLPFWFRFDSVPAIDWDGEYMYASASNWLAVVKPSDIYPRVSVDPEFAGRNNTVQVKAGNAGNVVENVAVYLNSGKDPIQAGLVSANQDNYTFTILTPDCDSSDKVYVKTQGYPSGKCDIINKARLIDYIPQDQRGGLSSFSPTGLFYDAEKSDLYTFDKLKTGNLSILRLHIEFDNDNRISVLRRTLPSKMQISVPIGICKVDNYIVAFSMTDKKCYWFDVNAWDSIGDAPVNTCLRLPFTPSAITGFSSPNGKKYVYIINSLCTSMGQSVFQLDLDTGLVKACSKLAVFCPVELYIDQESKLAFVSSSTGFDYISVFDPSLDASEITEAHRIAFPLKSAVYRLFSNLDFMFASCLCSKDIYVFGFNPSFVQRIIQHGLTSYYFSADNEYLVFGGKRDTNIFSLNIYDSNRWNDYPADLPFSLAYSLDSNAYILDMKLIKNKLFVVINKDIMIMDLPNRREESK